MNRRLQTMKTNLKTITTVLLSAFLSACGGELSVADNGGGITGTGITAGSVTAFGSIYVNGIKFDVDSATFSRDGVVSTGQSEFSLGEYVVIKGTVDNTGTAGIADDVSFEDLLEGVVTVASIDDVTIEILGQLVEIDSNTKLLIDSDNLPAAIFAKLSDLVVGNIVEVSGLKDSTGLIKATSIKLKEDSGSENELKGTISGIDLVAKTFVIGNILVDYSAATLDGFNGDPENGQFVEVNSSIAYDGVTLIADEVELEDEHLVIDTGTELEMEGIVTRFVSKLDFDVNGIPVTTNSETVYENGTENEIGLNTSLEVEGKINSSGILVAEEIEFED